MSLWTHTIRCVLKVDNKELNASRQSYYTVASRRGLEKFYKEEGKKFECSSVNTLFCNW